MRKAHKQLARFERGTIEVDAGDARVYVERHVYKNMGGSMYTRSETVSPARISACFPLGMGPSFSVVRQGFVQSLTKMLGGQDVVLGQEEFDRVFVVKTDDPARTRTVFSPGAMRFMLSLPNAAIQSDGLEVVCSGIDSNYEVAVDLVGELASADLYGLAELRALPTARYVAPAGPWDNRTVPSVVIADPGPVTFRPALDDDGCLVTEALLGNVDRAQHLDLTFEEGKLDQAQLPSLPRGANRFVSGVGSGRLTCADSVAQFHWHEIQTDLSALKAAAGLLACCAAPLAGGVFR